MDTPVAKSGWLYRQSTILRKWKRSWFILSRDGYLRFYENENSMRAEDALIVPSEVIAIKTGLDVEGVKAPDLLSNTFLISLEARSGRTWVVCGDSIDDMKAWHLALEQARVIQMHRNVSAVQGMPYGSYAVPATTGYVYSNPYNYPGHVIYNGQGSPYNMVQTGNSPATVIVSRQPRGYYNNTGSDMALGMVAGAALGTMMWAPLLWW